MSVMDSCVLGWLGLSDPKSGLTDCQKRTEKTERTERQSNDRKVRKKRQLGGQERGLRRRGEAQIVPFLIRKVMKGAGIAVR